MDVQTSSKPRLRSWLAKIAALAMGGAVALFLHAAFQPDNSDGTVAAQERANRANWSSDPVDPFPLPPELQGVNLLAQTDADKHAKSAGCITCHEHTHDPHTKNTVRLGCTDCHGGDPTACDKMKAHVQPRLPQVFRTSANPVRSAAALNHESPEFIRFVNPGDFRIAHISCGTTNCHPREVEVNRKGMMNHGCMLWGAALYNNGSVPYKRARHGEAYSMNGAPLRLVSNPPPSEWEMEKKGVVPFLDPLPRFEMSQPGNILRIFERGGRFRPEVGLPERTEEPGRPRTRLSLRGLGTENRTDPVLVSLNKTRLFDPSLSFIGTNDHPGDYRQSGCTACHVIYANDRSPVNSGPYAKFGNKGLSFNPDPTIPKNEPGHPIEHKFTLSIPTSQCIICHVHPGTTVMNSYTGYLWYDQETHGELMYPAKQKYPTAEDWVNAQMLNPEEGALRGNWIDPNFLNDITTLNPQMNKTQFADYHGHGWVFRAVFKQDKKGRLLDHYGLPVPDITPQKLMDAVKFPERAKDFHKKSFANSKEAADAERQLNQSRMGKPVHLLDIHLEKGMHCVDCHFVQDNHGNGRLQMEVRAATEIMCVDCHGTSKARATLKTSGPAAYTSAEDGQGRDLMTLRTPFGKPRFEYEGDRLFQNSMVEKGLRWEVVQVKDTLNPAHPRYNEKSRLAKTVRLDEKGKMVWGDLPPNGKCAHENDNMSCMTCHTSWNPSCYGCHLPQRANVKMPHTHWEGDVTRNYTPYNFQTLRDEVFMIARDGNVTGNKINPSRSSCAIHVGSYNNNRESIYVQQQTISGEGFSGCAFSTNVPHTVRGKGVGETKMCTDCHLSKDNDNNAWMAQLMMHGTNYLNFMGKYVWVACEDHGLHAPIVTEQSEPQAVIGSTLHAHAYPDFYKKHLKYHGELEHAHEHPGLDISTRFKKPLQEAKILSCQQRGEYCLCACGPDGVRAFDIAFIDDKAFAERITTAPVSPRGQKFHVPTKYCQHVAAPTTMAPDPTRVRFPENHEADIPLLFAFIYAADKYEGLILIQVGTMLDGNPDNNFLKRALTFNPDGILNGARFTQIVGNYAYVCADVGLVVINLEDPTKPKVTSVIEEPFLHHAHMVQVQFRYAYVVDEEGIKVLDVTDLAKPRPVSKLRIDDCHSIYLARTYAYVAGGKRGLVILDITKPDHPRLDQIYDAGGKINDLHDVKLAITYTSEFAYLADGKNGMRVVQLSSPDMPGNGGFGPRPTPCLIATYKVPHGGHAVSIGKALDRDRAVDESGNQLAVFGRVGARPLNKKEQEKLYMRNNKLWWVSDNPQDRDIYGPPNPYVEPREPRRQPDDSGLFREPGDRR